MAYYIVKAEFINGFGGRVYKTDDRIHDTWLPAAAIDGLLKSGALVDENQTDETKATTAAAEQKALDAAKAKEVADAKAKADADAKAAKTAKATETTATPESTPATETTEVKTDGDTKAAETEVKTEDAK
jgi:hypothetical protein